jgi:hypothetical protein
MNIMKRNLRTWILSLGTIFMILVGWAMPTLPQLPDDIPDFVKKVLEKEGVDLEELKNNPDLRREMREKVMSNPELQKKFQNMSGEKRKSEEAPQGKSEDKQRSSGGDKRQGKGGKGGGGADEYYKSIVDNNLFRPLGWGGEKRGPAFRLIGTVINQGKKPRALIFEFAKNTTHYVAMGDKIGNATVESIDEKSVTLNQDGEGPLKLNISQESPFLGGSGGGGGGGGGPQAGSHPSPPTKNVKSGGGPTGSGIKTGGVVVDKVQNMSPQEREKFIQQQMRESRRGERGGRSLEMRRGR